MEPPSPASSTPRSLSPLPLSPSESNKFILYSLSSLIPFLTFSHCVSLALFFSSSSKQVKPPPHIHCRSVEQAPPFPNIWKIHDDSLCHKSNFTLDRCDLECLSLSNILLNLFSLTFSYTKPPKQSIWHTFDTSAPHVLINTEQFWFIAHEKWRRGIKWNLKRGYKEKVKVRIWTIDLLRQKPK